MTSVERGIVYIGSFRHVVKALFPVRDHQCEERKYYEVIISTVIVSNDTSEIPFSLWCWPPAALDSAGKVRVGHTLLAFTTERDVALVKSARGVS